MDDIIFKSEEINVREHEHVSKNTGNVMYEQYLLNDEDTKMMIKQILYPKGTITPWHTHDCAHGMYVLEGCLLYTSRCV